MLPQVIDGVARRWLYAGAIIAISVIAAVDYVTPYEVSLFMLYLGPILLVAWYGDRKTALLIAIFAATVCWVANLRTQPWAIHIYVWRGLNKLISFSLLSLGASAMRAGRDIMQSRVEDFERTRQLEAAILRISEREQMRIGQDLHDGTCQHLAAIACAVECLKTDLAETAPAAAASASFIQDQLHAAIRDTRDLARGVFPVQMAAEGFLAALGELVSTMNRLRHLPVHLAIGGDIQIRDPQVAMHLYRIAQEALNNALHHAHASAVEINVELHEETLTMFIADDGVGMASPLPPSKGMGMQTMRYRARALGADLSFENIPTGGTLVRCTLHLAPEPTSKLELAEPPDLIPSLAAPLRNDPVQPGAILAAPELSA
jgi:signal transduction histidine kinase